jgi:hypothetical protein
LSCLEEKSVIINCFLKLFATTTSEVSLEYSNTRQRERKKEEKKSRKTQQAAVEKKHNFYYQPIISVYPPIEWQHMHESLILYRELNMG